MSEKPQLTPRHLSYMRHAVGFYSDWNPGFRNYFFIEPDDQTWTDLVELGFAEGREEQGDYVFHVTESGKKLIGLSHQVALVKTMNEQIKGTAK